MKEINVKLFIREDGSIQIHHEGTEMYTTFKNITLRSFLIKQEMDILKKLSVEENLL